MIDPYLTWQLHDVNEWRFGVMIRGVVRKPYYAEVYFDDGRLTVDEETKRTVRDPRWIWMVRSPNVNTRGTAGTFDQAVRLCEEALGIKDSPTREVDNGQGGYT